MTEVAVPADASDATTRAEWLAALDAIGEEAGYFEPLGDRHWAFFVDDGPVLLVTFETLSAIRARSPGQMPLGHDIARRKGWSHLCLIADGDTWYRDHRVWGYIDRLVDDAFFEDFDRVVFHGAGMGAYAACAFAVAAPGATVLAISPRATLAPDQAGWDRRALPARRLDFRSRYGYGPDMIDGAGKVFTLHDPDQTEDAMHVALYRKPYVTALTCRHAGTEPDAALLQMGLLEPLVEAACEGRLTRASWARMWRKRRGYGPWLRNLLARVGASGRPVREAILCRAVLSQMQAPRFRRRLQDLTAELEALGIELPPARSARRTP